MSWTLEKSGVYIGHVIISSSIIYRSDMYSNYRFSNGVNSYSREEMDEIVKRDRQIVEEEGLDLEFDDYYELVYKGKTKRYSEKDYNSFIDNLNEIKENSIELAFNY